jgi:hypothetical protein
MKQFAATAPLLNMDEDDNIDTPINWNELNDAIHSGDVATVETLLTLNPDLACYRDEYVSQ